MPDPRVFLIGLAALVVVATLLPLVPRPYWWVRMFDFPRVQIAAVAVGVLLALAVVVWRSGHADPATWAAFVALTACALYQGARMLPYSPLWPAQSVRADAAPEGRRLRVVVSNVLMENRDAERWARVVCAAEPDVVAVVEVDRWWTDRLGDALGEHPHRVEIPQDNTYGMALYSRYPLEEVEVEHLVEKTVPSIFSRVALPMGDRVRLVVVHPRPPRPDLAQGSELRDAELALVARALDGVPEGERGPTLVAGDLNDVAWSRTTRQFQKLSGLLDPRIGRGLFSTFHARYPFLRYPLDHVFHSPSLTLVDLRRLAHVGSDHFPMLIEVAVEPDAEAEQETPVPDADDVEDGREAVAEAREQLRDETPAEARERDQEDR